MELDECVFVCVLVPEGRMCVCLPCMCTGMIFLSVCRLAEVSAQTRSGWLSSCEHYTDTHTVALQLHGACQCPLGMAWITLSIQEYKICVLKQRYFVKILMPLLEQV